MKRISTVVMVVVVCVAGCSKPNTDAKEVAGAGDGDLSIPQALVDGGNLSDPDEILISVNGVELTRAEAMRQMQLRLGGPPPPDMPPERVAKIKGQVLSKVIDEFVKRELLLREAERLKIVAPEDDIEKAISAIRQRTPDGLDPKGILATGPAGDDTLRNEVITAIRVEQLLKTVLPPVGEPTDAEIDKCLQENEEKLTMPERVRASHILIEAKADMPETAKAAKRQLAESYRKQLLEGADFAKLAEGVSACPSASRGGDLGVFPRGKMAKPFEEAAFSQPEGEIGPVVETPFGFHIIRVVKHFAPGTADREQVATMLKQRARALLLADYVRKLQSEANITHSAGVRPPVPMPDKP